MRVAMALVVRDVVLNGMRSSCREDFSTFALHDERRVASNRISNLARLAP